MNRQEILDILKQGSNFELDEDGHGYGAINRCPECRDMTEYDYLHSHYPKKKALLESLPWNVVERPRNPKACEYPIEDGEYIVMLDCDEHDMVSIEKACDAYCKVCGHFAHSVPIHICRHDCEYFSDFKRYMEDK